MHLEKSEGAVGIWRLRFGKSIVLPEGPVETPCCHHREEGFMYLILVSKYLPFASVPTYEDL